MAININIYKDPRVTRESASLLLRSLADKRNVIAFAFLPVRRYEEQ